MKNIVAFLVLLLGFSFTTERLLDVPYYSPYLGYHYFTDSRDLNNAWELGIIVDKKLATQLFLEGNLGLIISKTKSSASDKWLLASGVNVVYDIAYLDKYSPYVLAGLGGDLGHNSLLGMNLGVGVKFLLSKYFNPRLEVKNIYYGDKGFDTVISLALTWPPIVNQLEEAYRATGKVENLNMNITFSPNKADVNPAFSEVLDDYAKFLLAHPETKLLINGYTDNTGDEAYNIELSQKRADAVAGVLINTYKISKDRVQTKGYGPANPVANNDTEEGKALNRRIEASTR